LREPIGYTVAIDSPYLRHHHIALEGPLMSPRVLIAVGALLAAVGIALGAFGAHALPGWLAAQGRNTEAVTKGLTTFETAVRYQMYQSFGLILLGLYASASASRATTIAGALMLLGMLIFSGLLYALVATDVKILGAIVPLGGVMMITGWATWAWSAWANR
jgi:uncharacterized membrane protein YgdD (TMEM256/DUF423 family)